MFVFQVTVLDKRDCELIQTNMKFSFFISIQNGEEFECGII